MQTTDPLSAMFFSFCLLILQRVSFCDPAGLLVNHVFAAALILNWLIVALVAQKLNELMADKPHSQPFGSL